MAYIKGAIPKTKVRDFAEHLTMSGFNTRPSASKWELYQVLLNGRWLAITFDAKDVVGLPEQLVPIAQDFLRGTFTPEITDTQRLEFILAGGRNIIKEIVSYNGAGQMHYCVYVAEGSWEEYVYPAVNHTGDSIAWVLGEGLEIQRQAIDLAINNPKSVSEKV